MTESYILALVKSLYDMVEELKRENARDRREREAAKDEMAELKRKENQNANQTLRRPYGLPPSYTSFALPVST